MADRDLVIAWLNDAFAMENALEEVLERHAADAADHPDVQAKIQDHIEQTRWQAEQVKRCIEQLGGNVSQAKQAFATFFGASQGMMNKPLQDTLVKNAISDYAAEHFEIASYQALIEAARNLGEQGVVDVLEEILAQERDMAAWLAQQLPATIREHVGATT